MLKKLFWTCGIYILQCFQLETGFIDRLIVFFHSLRQWQLIVHLHVYLLVGGAADSALLRM